MRKLLSIFIGSIILFVALVIGEITGVHRSIAGLWIVSAYSGYAYFSSEKSDKEKEKKITISLLILAVVTTALYYTFELLSL